MDDIPIRFDFAGAQQRLYREWESRGFFHAEPPRQEVDVDADEPRHRNATEVLSKSRQHSGGQRSAAGPAKR